MKQVLTLVVAAAVIISFSQSANGQQAPYSPTSQTHSAAQMASLPPGMIANMRNRQWRSWNASSQSTGQMVAQNFNDNPASAVYSFVPNQDSIPASQNGFNANSYYPVARQANPGRSSLYVEPSVANSSPGSYGTGSWQLGSGYVPYVMGDIFEVGRDDYCDEWANLCPCLELTNGRSNCGCTNPYRTKLGDPCRHGYRINQTGCSGGNPSVGGCSSCSDAGYGCQSCARSARQSSVSDYFHPPRNR